MGRSYPAQAAAGMSAGRRLEIWPRFPFVAILFWFRTRCLTKDERPTCARSSLVFGLSSLAVCSILMTPFPARYRQATEARCLRPLVIAVEANLGAPARVCQRFDQVAHQRAALEWRAPIALHQVSQPNLRRKVAGDLVGRE